MTRARLGAIVLLATSIVLYASAQYLANPAHATPRLYIVVECSALVTFAASLALFVLSVSLSADRPLSIARGRLFPVNCQKDGNAEERNHAQAASEK